MPALAPTEAQRGSVIEVTQPAEVTRLVTLSQLRRQMQIEDESEDVRLDEILDVVSSDFAGPYGLAREPWRQSYEEVLDRELLELALRDDCRELPLSRWPIESVESVECGLSGSDLIDPETYRIKRPEAYALWRQDGWPVGDYRVRYTAGYLMPGQVTTWAPEMEYSAPTWVKPTTASLLLFELTQGGQSGQVEPEWADAAAIVDGGAVWAARPAAELPAGLWILAVLHAKYLYRDPPGEVARMSDAGGSVTFRKATAAPFTETVRNALSRFR